MDREPEIEFEIVPRPAAMKKFALSEEECVDIVAEGLAIYLDELGKSQDAVVPKYEDHKVLVAGKRCRLGDLAEIEILGDYGDIATN